jgi:hypothetical protein
MKSHLPATAVWGTKRAISRTRAGPGSNSWVHAVMARPANKKKIIFKWRSLLPRNARSSVDDRDFIVDFFGARWGLWHRDGSRSGSGIAPLIRGLIAGSEIASEGWVLLQSVGSYCILMTARLLADNYVYPVQFEEIVRRLSVIRSDFRISDNWSR